MPSPALKRKKRREKMTFWKIYHLLTGNVFFAGEGFDQADAPAMKAAWVGLEGTILPIWVQYRPGTRPAAWWLFAAPERRQRIDGKPHPFDNPERAAKIERVGYVGDMNQLCFGKPNFLIVRDDFDARYETEADFLARLNLLREGEAAASTVEIGAIDLATKVAEAGGVEVEQR